MTFFYCYTGGSSCWQWVRTSPRKFWRENWTKLRASLLGDRDSPTKPRNRWPQSHRYIGGRVRWQTMLVFVLSLLFPCTTCYKEETIVSFLFVGSMFVGSHHYSGLLGRNFVGSKISIILINIKQILCIGSWGCKFIGKFTNKSHEHCSPRSNDDSMIYGITDCVLIWH